VFYYTAKYLEFIALNYRLLYYDGLPEHTKAMMSLVENKCDFDASLDRMGKGRWLDTVRPMMTDDMSLDELEIDLYLFGNMQKTVIAQVLGWVTDDDLVRRYHIDNPDSLRYRAYERMARILNRGY